MEKESFEHYKIGIESIDAEHWELIQQLNILESLSCEDENIGVIFDNIVRLSENHFTNEERYMEVHKYPYLNFHSMQHKFIISNIKAQKEFGLTPMHLKSTIKLLEESIIDHIDKYDRQISKL